MNYWLYESFLKTDFDGDGIAELRKVCTIGDKVLQNDEIDKVPFVSITPVKIPHKFFGLSVADLIMDLQLMKSTLMRNLMDNMYNMNFGRYAVLEGQANLDDLLTQRPGGIVRVKSPNAVTPLTTPPLEPYTFQMLEYLDGVRDEQATRELIAQENRRYAKRQLIWFRKEPNLRWIDVSGEHPDAFQKVVTELLPRLH